MNFCCELGAEGAHHVVKLCLLSCDGPCSEVGFHLREPDLRIGRPKGRDLYTDSGNVWSRSCGGMSCDVNGWLLVVRHHGVSVGRSHRGHQCSSGGTTGCTNVRVKRFVGEKYYCSQQSCIHH